MAFFLKLQLRLSPSEGLSVVEHVVGIDLGTTNSLCAVFRKGQPELIRNAHGDVLTPSIVGILEDGQVVIGAPAKELRVTSPERCASAFKRLMGTNRNISLAGKTFSAPELSSLVLRSLREDAEAALGGPVTEAVITVPAYFNDFQRKATKHAGELAGLTVRRIINEPTAAALTYGFHDRDADKKLIIIDLGGGTFDVTLMQIFEGTLEIISTAGESFLGGEDFTDRLVATVLKQLWMALETAEHKTPRLVSRLREECERAKRAFLTEEQAVVRVPDENGELHENATRITISRDEFAQVSMELIERLRKPIGKALRDADTSPDEVDDVILVGGATRMPIVRDTIRELFGRDPLCTFNPDEVVGLGAAVQAALMTSDAAVDDMVMTDVCPFTLGVETAKQFAHQTMDGYYTPIIHRNTTIPVSREEFFGTLTAGQTVILLNIFQGESRRVKDNLKLGELKVTGIPAGPPGQQIGVRFSYDLNGILEVEAYIPETGRRFVTVLTNHARHMSEAEVAAAVERLRAVKFYPRDDVANQRLVLFVERMIGEVPPMERQTLEETLSAFEAAMASGDREQFAAVRQGLLVVLSSLGIEYDEYREQPDAEN